MSKSPSSLNISEPNNTDQQILANFYNSVFGAQGSASKQKNASGLIKMAQNMLNPDSVTIRSKLGLKETADEKAVAKKLESYGKVFGKRKSDLPNSPDDYTASTRILKDFGLSDSVIKDLQANYQAVQDAVKQNNQKPAKINLGLRKAITKSSTKGKNENA
jgi:hypothetical protein